MFANILTIDGYTRGKYFKLCLFKNNLFPTFLRKFLIIIINYCFKKRGGIVSTCVYYMLEELAEW